LVPFNGVEGFLSPLPVGVVPGIGPKTQEFLKAKGILTIGDLQRIEGGQLLAWFGKNGVWLWGVVHGEEGIEVKQQEMPKSLSVERTFKDDVVDFASVRKEAADATSEVARRVKAARLTFRVAGIKIRFAGFETHTRERTLPSHTDSEDALGEAVGTLLDEFEGTGRAFRLVGVRVSDLQRISSEASKLDDWAGPSEN